MSTREVSREELARMQVQMQELTTRLDAMEIQGREEKTRFEASLRQIMADHRDEIYALTERYKRERSAFQRDLNNLRQENDRLTQENQRLIADLQLTRQNNPVMVPVPVPFTSTTDHDRDSRTIDKFIEFLKAEGNDLYWQKFFAGAEGTTGIGLAVGAYFAAPNLIVILLAMLAAGVTIDALRRAYIAFTAPHDHQE